MRRPPTILASALVLAVAAVALGLAACGGDDGEATVTVQQTETVTTPGGDRTEPDAGAGGSEGPEPLTAQDVGPEYFQTPSGNIGCIFGGGQVRCDIAERDWAPPAPPADCQLDFGQGIALTAGGTAAFVCAGDTALGGPATLGYGEVAQRDTLRCTSERSGITCIEIENASGFVLSRQSYRLL